MAQRQAMLADKRFKNGGSTTVFLLTIFYLDMINHRVYNKKNGRI
jgi:hypothetical protein